VFKPTFSTSKKVIELSSHSFQQLTQNNQWQLLSIETWTHAKISSKLDLQSSVKNAKMFQSVRILSRRSGEGQQLETLQSSHWHYMVMFGFHWLHTHRQKVNSKRGTFITRHQWNPNMTTHVLSQHSAWDRDWRERAHGTCSSTRWKVTLSMLTCVEY